MYKNFNALDTIQNIYKPAISSIFELEDLKNGNTKPFVYILPNDIEEYMNTSVLEEAKHLVNYSSNVNLILNMNDSEYLVGTENNKSFRLFIENTMSKDITLWLMCTSSNFVDFLIDMVHNYCEKFDITMGVCIPLQTNCFQDNILTCKKKKIPAILYNNLFVDDVKLTDELLIEHFLFTKKYCKYMTIYWLLEPVNLENFLNFKKYMIKFSEKVIVSMNNKPAIARYKNSDIQVYPMTIIGDIVSYYIGLLKTKV